MRKSFLAALALTALGFAAPAFAGDVKIDNSTVTAAVAGTKGEQSATSVGQNSIAQAGLASVQSAGSATVKIDRSTVDLSGTTNEGAKNTATSVGAFSIAQAGIASIQGADICGCENTAP